jgi:serine/threonine-protein kinase
MASEMLSNRYIIVRKVGEGGMATVYLAIDTILKREVAIKILRADLSTDEVSLKRFQREAMAITSTSSPNIVEVFDVGKDGEKYYIVMEYVYGRTLKNLVRQRGVIPVDEAVNIMKQLVSATAHAHHQGIIHRDIKSQNVLVKDDGTVKLSDFGIAQMGDAGQQITQAQTVVGSVHYLAPEVSGGKPATFQSDIYSLGIVFYELLTGDVPFHGETAVEVALKHMHNDVPHVRQFDPTIPQSVENIIIRATSRNPELRYESADRMYSDLVTCLDLTRNYEEVIDLTSESLAKQKAQKLQKEKEEALAHPPTLEERIHDDNQRKIMIYGLLAGALLFLIIVVGIGIFRNAHNNRVTIPDILQFEVTEARQRLESLELKIEKIDYVVSEEVAKGKVIAITPVVGSEVSRGSSVVLTVSLGKTFTVGNYVGQNIANVKTQLEKEGFRVNVYYVEDNAHNAYGTIISQDIPAGTVYQPGNTARTIAFEIADYPTFTIPASLRGMEINDARAMLEDMGAVVILSQLPIEENIDAQGKYINPLGTVVRTDPAINTVYRQTDGAVLTLYYY